MPRAGLAALLLSLAAPAAASDLSLALPIDCDLASTCRIQQFVDHDPGPGARDYRCGPMSYDGHKGTDFAVPTLADMDRGVNVLAAADGVVTGLRDGMPDRAFSAADAPEIDGRDCGNGVLLRHADGWETQYCHMKNGSLRVARGQSVRTGEVLGEVGLSGRTQFPHVHLSVRRDGKVVDPFAPGNPDACGAADSDTLWAAPPDYRPGGLIEAGFAAAIPDYAAVQAGTAATAIGAGDPALVFFVYGFAGRKGDAIRLRIDGPAGTIYDARVTLDRDQALFFRAGGKRLRAPRWPAGDYVATARMVRDDQPLAEITARMRID